MYQQSLINKALLHTEPKVRYTNLTNNEPTRDYQERDVSGSFLPQMARGELVENVGGVLSLDALKINSTPSVQGQGGGNIYSSELYSQDNQLFSASLEQQVASPLQRR